MQVRTGISSSANVNENIQRNKGHTCYLSLLSCALSESMTMAGCLVDGIIHVVEFHATLKCKCVTRDIFVRTKDVTTKHKIKISKIKPILESILCTQNIFNQMKLLRYAIYC